MEGLPVIKISVRNLVEFILRTGDIDNRTGASARADAMQEGSKMHRNIQRRMGASYQAEVPLKTEIETEQYVLVIEGRADGIIREAADAREAEVRKGAKAGEPGSGNSAEAGESEPDNSAKAGESGSGNSAQGTGAALDGCKGCGSVRERVVIDEIKCVYRNLAQLEGPVFLHQAQAMCYAYMYAREQGLGRVGVQMTYCNLETEEIRRFYEEFSFSDRKSVV